MTTRKRRPRIPTFQSNEEEAAFWEAHLEEFEPFFEKVHLRFARPLQNVFELPLDGELLDGLIEMARAKSMPIAELMQTWLRERLEQEHAAQEPKQPPKRRAGSG